ncbi:MULTISPECIES: hypothetical protein [unclassified Schlesneria]|uniref:hypothetical protein n=1 Tax=Schlesneria TaxID=656899 RepID=UPI002F0E82AD
MPGELLIRWTARFAVACYVARLLYDAAGMTEPSAQRQARWWWTVGCGWFILHVVSAFHFLHEWNHDAAYTYTAKRTAELTGWSSGLGLYINEAFVALWVVDTLLWWRDLSWPNNRSGYWGVQTVFAFLMIQATAVFGPSFWIPIVIMIAGLLAVVRLLTRAGVDASPAASELPTRTGSEKASLKS